LTDYFFKNSKSFDENYKRIKKITMLDKPELMAIDGFVKHANFVDGDIAEVGCNKCGTTYMILSSAFPHKKVFALDTFCGLPYVDVEDRTNFIDRLKRGLYSADEAKARKLLSSFNDRAIIIKGLFVDSFTDYQLINNKFSFVFIDADLYQSTLQSFEFFWNRMTPGGFLATHDYKFHLTPGVEKAVNEFFGSLDDYEHYRISNILAIRKE
jgi:O-methyltransferase